MHIINDYCGLRVLSEAEEKHFIDIYNETPDEFMEQCGSEYSIDDLKNMYVISVESRIQEPKVIEDGKYCVNILDVYTPRDGQKATLDYCGHITFIEVKDAADERITLLYKDDECFPQQFSEWYEEFIDNEDKEWSNGIIPTKAQVLEIVKVMIRGFCQNPDLDVDINENNVIVLQGL